MYQMTPLPLQSAVDGRDKPLPVPPRSRRRPSLAQHTPFAPVPVHEQHETSGRDKSSVFGFFSSPMAASAADKHPSWTRTASLRRHEPLSSDDSVYPRPERTKLRLSLSRRRKESQPTFSMMRPRSVAAKTNSQGPQKRLPHALRPAPPRDWFPPSASESETDLAVQSVPRRLQPAVQSILRQRQSSLDVSDLSSDEDSLVAELRRSPAAVYMLSTSQERDYSDLINNHSLQPHPSFGAVWIDNTDAKLDVLPLRTRKDKQVIVQEQELQEPAGDNGWPLSTPNLADPELPVKQTHVSTLSRTTTSTIETVVSPTFSAHQVLPYDVSPSSSVGIEHTEEPVDPLLLFVQKREVGDRAASIAPSEVSEKWHQSSKERLGLGGSLKRCDDLPWADSLPMPRQPPNRIDSNLTRRKSNRISAFLGWS